MAESMDSNGWPSGPMQWLREQAHRSRFMAGFFDQVRFRRRQRRFDDHLEASLGVALRWHTRQEAFECLCQQLDTLLAVEPPPFKKGSPSRVAIREPDLTLLKNACRSVDSLVGDEELQAAARVASLEPASIESFKLYLAAYWLHHEAVILGLRAALSGHVVLHMSCAPRLARADASIASFKRNGIPISHVKLIGNGQKSTFDAAEKLLSVAAADNYESLPQKMFQGLGLVIMACNPPTILKLDDDHRLRDLAELSDLLRFAENSEEPMQLGNVNRAEMPSAHHRAWHFGKCANTDLNDTILAVPAPMEWAAGSSGYILNRPAMRRIFWASLYYERWINGILYEDLALAETAGKTGIRLVSAPLNRAIGAVSAY